MSREHRRLVLGAIWTLSSTAVSLAVGIALRPIFVFYVGIEGYGTWAAALAIASLIGLVGDLGVGATLTRVAAERQGRNAEIGTLAASALLLAICMGALFGLILASLSGLIAQFLAFPGFGVLLLIQGIQMPINLGIAALAGLLQGRRRFRSLALFSIAQASGNLVLAVTFLAVGLGLFGLMLASLATSALVFGALVVHSRDLLRFSGLVAVGRDARQLLPFGLQLTGTNALSTILYHADIVVLSLFVADPAVIGTYALAVFVTRSLWIVPGSISVTTYPVVSEYRAAQDGKRVAAYLTTALVTSVAITGAFASGLVLFGRPLLGLLFGTAAVPAYELCLVLLFGTGALGSLRAVAPSIPGAGRPDIGLRISAPGASAVFALSLVFTVTSREVGTALAVSISFASVAALLVWAIHRYVLAPNRGRWKVRRIALTTAISLAATASATLVALPEKAEATNVLLGLALWTSTLAVLGLASGGRETWGRIFKRSRASAQGRD